MSDIVKVAGEAYKMALDEHKSAKAKMLGLQLQLLSMDADMKKKRNVLIGKDEFAVLKNDKQRDAFLDEHLLVEKDAKLALESEIMKVSYALSDAKDNLTYFKDVFRAAYLPTDKE